MKQKILIVGLSGNMGKLTAERIFASSEYDVMPFGIVAQNEKQQFVKIGDNFIQCVPFNQVHKNQIGEGTIIVDFTHKDAIINNWNTYYKEWGLPLIIGTIGVKKSDLMGNKAPVIIGSPNLCPQIVEILKTFSSLEEESLNGISFEITESHQASKKEVSGTANRMKELFEKAGGNETSPIKIIRDPEEQLKMGVPREFLDGHGWHTYHFFGERDSISSHNTVQLMNVCSTLWDKVTNKAPIKEGGFSRLVGHWDNPTKTLHITYGQSPSMEVVLVHNINGRQPYIDGLFETVLPAMQEMINIGDNSVKDMFDL